MRNNILAEAICKAALLTLVRASLYGIGQAPNVHMYLLETFWLVLPVELGNCPLIADCVDYFIEDDIAQNIIKQFDRIHGTDLYSGFQRVPKNNGFSTLS